MRKALLWLVTIIVVAIGVFYGRRIADWAMPPPVGGRPTHELLAEAIEKTNRGLPTMIDKETRLDRVTQPSSNVLQNNHTLLNIDTPLPGEFANIEKQVRQMIVGKACSTPSVARLLDRGITNVYAYNAADGKFFGSVTVTKADCLR